MGSHAYREHRATRGQKKASEYDIRSKEATDQHSDIGWQTLKMQHMIRQAKEQIVANRKTRADHSNYPLDQAHHILARYRINSLIRGCSYDQKVQLGDFLGIKKFAEKSPEQQELCSFPPNVFLGPSEAGRSDRTQSHKVEEVTFKKPNTKTNIRDIRMDIFTNIETIMLNRGVLIKENLITNKEPFTPEGFKMILLCFKAIMKTFLKNVSL